MLVRKLPLREARKETTHNSCSRFSTDNVLCTVDNVICPHYKVMKYTSLGITNNVVIIPLMVAMEFADPCPANITLLVPFPLLNSSCAHWAQRCAVG